MERLSRVRPNFHASIFAIIKIQSVLRPPSSQAGANSASCRKMAKVGREKAGLAIGTIFTVAGFIMGFFGDTSSGGSTPPDYGPILNSINQTVTETYQGVLQIQDQLQTIAGELATLSDQITTGFNALNSAVLKADCTSAFGTWRARLGDRSTQSHMHAPSPIDDGRG